MRYIRYSRACQIRFGAHTCSACSGSVGYIPLPGVLEVSSLVASENALTFQAYALGADTVRPQRSRPFNSMGELTAVIDWVLIQHGVKLHTSDRMKKFIEAG